jgi:CrcB protein
LQTILENIVAVAAGATLGALVRYAITHFSSQYTGHSGFPYGTLAVNVIGSLFVGWILTWTADQSQDRWRLFAATGFCGAFTTFSAFAFESMAYWHDGKMALFAINVAANNALCFAGVAAGVALRYRIR